MHNGWHMEAKITDSGFQVAYTVELARACHLLRVALPSYLQLSAAPSEIGVEKE